MGVELLNFKCPNCGKNMRYRNNICKCEYCETEFYLLPKNKVDIVLVTNAIPETTLQILQQNGFLYNELQSTKKKCAREIGEYLLNNGYIKENVHFSPISNTINFEYSCFVVKPDKEE